jgi:hypothetical protein
MAQTKRKRRSKHRGTAAGTIESRGRTGRKPTADEQRRDRGALRQDRLNRPPSWKNATIRAGFASALLFVFTQLGLGGDMSVGRAIALCAMAMIIYVPLGYQFDKWMYNRRNRQKTAAKP